MRREESLRKASSSFFFSISPFLFLLGYESREGHFFFHVGWRDFSFLPLVFSLELGVKEKLSFSRRTTIALLFSPLSPPFVLLGAQMVKIPSHCGTVSFCASSFLPFF